MSFAEAACSDIIEGCLNYTKTLLRSQQRLVLPILLLLALLRLHRLQCCCHRQECITQHATHAPCLQSSVLKQRKALQLSQLQIRLCRMQI